MQILLIFLLIYIFGNQLLKLFKLNLSTLEYIPASMISGLSFFTVISFCLSNIFGLNYFSQGLTISIVTLFSAIVAIFSPNSPNFFKIPFKKIYANKALSLTLIFFIIFFVKIFSQQYKEETNGLYAGWVGSWGDGAYHLTLTNSFLRSDNFWPNQPIYSGEKLNYHFLPDYFISTLLLANNNLSLAITTSSIVILSSVILLLFTIFKKLTGSSLVASLSIFIAFFSGGFGFYHFFLDLMKEPSIQTLLFPPREYTHIEEGNFIWLNFVSGALVPQRAFIFGLSHFVLIFFLIKKGVYSQRLKYFLLAAILTAFLPFFHIHSLLALGIFLTSYFIISYRKSTRKNMLIKNVAIYFVLSSVVILPQISIFIPKNGVANTLHLTLGWLNKTDDFFTFWLKNTGLLIPLSLLSFFVINKLNRSIFLLYYLPFLVMFIISNLVIFQPYEYDNSKVFFYWYIFTAPLAALTIASYLKANYVHKIVGGTLLTILILTGLVDNVRLLNYEKNKILMFDREKILLSEFVVKNTEPHSIFLTAANHDNPIPTLTGRTILLGYPGWLWSYGIDYTSREADIKSIYETPELALRQIDDYNISYIYIGSAENGTYNVDSDYFQNNFESIYNRGDNTIYKVSHD